MQDYNGAVLYDFKSTEFTVPSSETQHKGVHLNADHFLWDVHHGIS